MEKRDRSLDRGLSSRLPPSRFLAGLSQADQIDMLCDAFEQAWKEGLRPSMVEFLEPVSESCRSELLRHLLALDREYRERRGDRLTLSDYQRELPRHAELLQRLLDDEATATWSAAEKTGIDPPPTGPDKTPGRQLGDYRLLEEIGRGGMGVVYRAHQASLNREVAVKVILPGRFVGPEALQRFRVEAEAAANLNHPGVVSVFEIGEHQGQPFFSLELVDGANLRELVRQGPLPSRRAAELVRQTAEIIEFSHQQGIVHRDLKPANVLVDNSGNVRVTDFGLAKRRDDDSNLTTTGDVLGTPCYMPPEQATGQLRDVGPASDVYSLGAILYCLITARPPFQSATVVETLRQVVEKEPLAPRRLDPDIPPDLDTICRKCLEKQVENRYPSAQALVEELDRFLAGEPIAARSMGSVGRGWRWCRRQPAAAMLLLLLVVLAIVGPAVAFRERLLRQRLVQAERQELAAMTRGLFAAEPRAVPPILELLTPAAPDLIDRLQAVFRDEAAESRDRLRAALILADHDKRARSYLRERLNDVTAEEFSLVREALFPFRGDVCPELWRQVAAKDTSPTSFFRAACALARYAPDDDRWERIAPSVARCLVERNPMEVGTWLDMLRPAREHLLRPFMAIAANPDYPVDQQLLATRAVAEFGARQPHAIVSALLEADERRWRILLPAAREMRELVVPLLEGAVHPVAAEAASGERKTQEERDATASRSANAALALARLGNPQWADLMLEDEAFEQRRVRTYIILRWKPFGLPAQLLIRRLSSTASSRKRHAVLLALGAFSFSEICDAAGGTASGRELASRIERYYREDPNAGVHAAARRLLVQWGRARRVAELDARLADDGILEKRSWYVHPEGPTMVRLEDPATFWMGSEADEPWRDADESRHFRRIGRGFAISATEVTNRQFDRFLRTHPQMTSTQVSKYSPSPDAARVVVSWFEAAAFCNWLSEREGLAEDQWCYPNYDDLRSGVPLPGDFLERRGYRLPTEAEWEYACRAGTTTPRYYGYDEQLLIHFAWYRPTRELVAPVGQLLPNDFGLFDTYGNVWEWCQNRKRPYPSREDSQQAVPDRVSSAGAHLDENFVLRGGAVDSGPGYLRSADRSWYAPNTQSHVVGFRPARTLHTLPETKAAPTSDE